ncbi:MAG TPA: LysR family transcriptional regulator [Candidatus Anaerostipes excrementavium]|uniref:LysR family transcriptional regulator n=1 Tax=Candidatus Anaerostipes excrementavium TaxID=2838463 RepID=A0A9D1WW60_9FIRM|nr:LysR family transcriptional regulator [uncultured Anaerostipes sp.]HIX68136.1 LysR family transcriptional regulator [Candidatus Anaerostipes excrementavium]
MNTFQLDCFLAVAEYLNFAKAAEQMNISQPSITHQIQSLENELNVKLFRRTTRSVEMTTEGIIFQDDAKQIVYRSKRAIMRFAKKDNREILDFSIDCSNHSHFTLLSDVLQIFLSIYPNVHPNIIWITPAQLLERMKDGSFDIAFGIKNPGMAKGGLTYRELRKIYSVCLFRSEHPFSEKDSLTIDDLQDQNHILYHPDFTLLKFPNCRCWYPKEKILLNSISVKLRKLPYYWFMQVSALRFFRTLP